MALVPQQSFFFFFLLWEDCFRAASSKFIVILIKIVRAGFALIVKDICILFFITNHYSLILPSDHEYETQILLHIHLQIYLHLQHYLGLIIIKLFA